ncbi:MAG TPA: glycine zipper 2TM domain-containing protein [Rhodanobacter sp.]
MNALVKKIAIAATLSGALGLVGCASTPYGNDGYSNRSYEGQGRSPVRCQSCGVVQEVQQVYIDGNNSGGTLGAIIGAVAGGALGNQVGKGDGRKAATVAGAVAGGVVGNQVGKRNSGDQVAWRIVVRQDNGQYVTVTQRNNPGVRRGDYVEVRGDHVYAR